jgi:hypothetical protein
MPAREGLALFQTAHAYASRGPICEIGTYCGKSAVYLGAAAREAGTVVFTVDHHRGSEEIQPGWAHHDPTLMDLRFGKMDSLPFFRSTIAAAGLEDTVIAVVGRSEIVARYWNTPLAMLFIDGGHSDDPVTKDYEGWAPHIMSGGALVTTIPMTTTTSAAILQGRATPDTRTATRNIAPAMVVKVALANAMATPDIDRSSTRARNEMHTTVSTNSRPNRSRYGD